MMTGSASPAPPVKVVEAKIFVDETPRCRPRNWRARATSLVKREHGLDLIVVDYLQLMQVPGNKENRATESRRSPAA